MNVHHGTNRLPKKERELHESLASHVESNDAAKVLLFLP